MVIIIGIVLLFIYAALGFKKPAVALLTLPVAMLLPPFYADTVAGTEDAMLCAVLFIPLIFLTPLIAAVVSGSEESSKKWPRKTAKCTLIGLIVIVLLAALFVLFGFGGFIGFLLFAMLIASAISYGYTTRRVTAAYVISTIGACMRQNLPLSTALDTAASGQNNQRARVLRQIQKWIVQGYSLSESIKRGYPKCPGYAVAMIESAESINQLPLTIKAIEENMLAQAKDNRKVKPFDPVYPIVIMSAVLVITLMLTTFAMPQFAAVLKEMADGAPLPVPTQILMNFTDFILGMNSLVVSLISLIIFIIIPASIRIKYRPRRPHRPYLASKIGDFIKWHLPALHWFEKNYSMVQAVSLLRLSLNSGCTVNEAIDTTLGLDLNHCFKKRLQKWLKKVERGENISSAAKESRLGSCIAWAFDSNINQGNTPAILDALESLYRSNYSYYVNLIRYAMGPVTTIMLGGVVGFVVYSIFASMISMINHLSDLVIP